VSASSQFDARTSEIPVSGEQASGLTSLAPRLAPAFWLDRLLRASTEAPYEQGAEATAEHFLLAAVELLPDLGVGLLARLPDGSLLAARCPAGVASEARVFPEAPVEHRMPVAFPPGAELRWFATGEPFDEGPELHFLRSLAQALGPALRLAWRNEGELLALQRQIAQADKLASIGRLAATTLHELNNPLTSILAYAEYLRRKVERVPLEADDVDRLRRIIDAAERIRGLTRNLIDYARPSETRPGPLRLVSIIDRALLFCEHILSDSGVAIEREYDGRADVVLGVEGELLQVLVNLITNACQAMPRGNGHLLLRTEVVGAQIAVRLHDNGHGVPPELLDKIFDPFFTTKALGSGTGLGLSIVRTIVERHGGSVSAESQPGQGATFSVWLPRG